jgi:hypothetical protein
MDALSIIEAQYITAAMRAVSDNISITKNISLQPFLVKDAKNAGPELRPMVYTKNIIPISKTISGIFRSGKEAPKAKPTNNTAAVPSPVPLILMLPTKNPSAATRKISITGLVLSNSPNISP